MLDVVGCGELLVDFVASEAGVTLAEATTFVKAAGGAPANVAVGVARLGRGAGFMGQVGDDDFGHFLAATLGQHGVDTGGLRFSRAARTALAFVALGPDGERDFMFYRHPSADMLWRPEEVDTSYAAGARVFHYGSISLIDEPSRSATLTALRAARAAGALISYDPNLRLPLWPSADAARAGIRDGLRHADLVKLSQEELAFLTGVDDLAGGARALDHERFKLLVVTRGAAGCVWFTPGASGAAPGFAVRPVDTTGAGDAFVAGLLTGLLDAGLGGESWGPEAIVPALRLANAAGALTTTCRGAIPCLPDRAAIARLLAGATG